MTERVGGIIKCQVDGEELAAKGAFTWNLGKPVRASVMGSAGHNGFTETPQAAFIDGVITVTKNTNVEALLAIINKTVTLETASGKSIMLANAFCASEGTGNTEQGDFPIRFEAAVGVEL